MPPPSGAASLTSHEATRQPSWAKRRAVALPMPAAPPVTITTLSRSPVSIMTFHHPMQMRRVVFEVSERRNAAAHHLILPYGFLPLLEGVGHVHVEVGPEPLGVFPVIGVVHAAYSAPRRVIGLQRFHL